jgi:PAS domain S-box-containing protein
MIMNHSEPAASAETVADLRALLAAAERALAARDKTIQALVTREKDREAKRHSTFGDMEENAALQQVVARKVPELEVQNRKLAQTTNALRETSSLLEVLLENTPVHIYFKDEQSRFVRFSKSLQDAFGQSEAAALEGKTDFDFLGESYARESFADEQAILRSGEPIIGKTETLRHADGRVRWSLTTKMPWRDKDGRIIGTFGISSDLTAIKAAEAELEVAHKLLVNTARQAGMAEVATGVLHNVGNVLNSVNVSATLVADHLRHTQANNIAKVAAMFEEHKADLAGFLTKDARGQMIPAYLGTLAESLATEQKTLITELEHLHKNVEHIKDIVAMQQAYAGSSGAIETVSLPDLIEDALRINSGSLARHNVETFRDYQACPVVTTDKHKVIQILINLVRNAEYACDESGRTDKHITVRTTSDDRGIHIAVIDNGVGIPAENLTRIFNHGFTTRKTGHGFGLHSGALAARELGGSLIVRSDGPGLGATFILELPYAPPPAASIP